MAYNGANNSMNSRDTPAIACWESNDSTGFFFMLLDTGKHLHCNKWNQLTITEGIIDIVHDLYHDARIDVIYKKLRISRSIEMGHHQPLFYRILHLNHY